MEGREPAVVYAGPESEAQQVAAMLGAHGIPARVHSQAGGTQSWPLSGPYDSRVVVEPGQARHALDLLRLNPRWAPVDEATEAREVEHRYTLFMAAIVVAGVAGLGLVLFALLR